MKFNIQTLRESLNHPKSGKKVFTEGKKQNVILSEEQLDRLLLQLEESREKSINRTIKDAHKLIREAIKNENLDLSVSNYSGTLIKEGYSKDEEGGATYNKDAKKGSTYDLGEQGMYDRNPGLAAAEGLENVINGIKKAYDMIKDSDTRKRLANSMTKLGNFMTITADAIGSGRDQRAPRPTDSLRDALPYPELETVTVDDEIEDEISENEEVEEVAKPDFLDLDKDGDKKESMKKAAKDKEVKEVDVIDVSDADGIELITRDEDESLEESKKERLIQEDIKKMKQIIKPITKI